jgi:ribosome-binding factor A
MPPPRRIARLQQLILEGAAQAVHREVADPRLGFVTLTRVKLGKDLADATIHWSCLGTEAQRRTSARALEAATALVQSVVAKALRTRTTPTLVFRYDPSVAHAGHLETVFEKIRRERSETPTPPPEGDLAPTTAPDAAPEPGSTESDGGDLGDAAPPAKPWARKKPRKA